MNIITHTPCAWCDGTGHRRSPGRSWRNPKPTCSRCDGPGYTEQRTTFNAVTIGPGWFSDAPMSREQRADVAMLAAALGAADWPPRT